MKARWLVLSSLVGCIESSSVVCGAQQVCPSGSICRHLTGPDDDGEDICASPEQIDACANVVEGDSCMLDGAAPSWCHDGVCLPIVCGNLRVDATEACDDGNTQSGDRSCSADCSSNEQCGNGVVDPLVREGNAVLANEECDDANAVSGDGCSSSCKTEVPRWSRLSELPGALAGARMVYDPVRERLVMFGGITTVGTKDEPTNVLYEWNGSNWASIPSRIEPSARLHAAMAYDTARRKLVLFGGQIGDAQATLGDLWEWDGTNWTLLTPAVAPSARTQAAMVYDVARKTTVLFGGFADTATGQSPSDETWEWDGTTWTQITAATHPAARHNHVMAYDPQRAVVVMAGGYDDTPGATIVYRRDTWEYNGTWAQTNTSTPVDLDSKSTLAYDPIGSRMIAFGGIKPEPPEAISPRTWQYSGGTWTDLGDGTPLARHDAAMATDLRNGEIILFGGVSSSGPYVDTTWRWSGSAWSAQPVAVFEPPRMSFTTSARDPLHGRTWVYGGLFSSFSADRLLMFDGTTWALHPAIGPAGRLFAGIGFDPLLDQLVLFGGANDVAGSLVPNDETWTFNGTSWTQQSPATVPAARYGASMYFDPNRGRVVMFGGANPAAPDPTTWEWTGTNWQAIPTTGPTPADRALGNVTFDAARGVCVLYSGVNFVSADFVGANDTWHFDGTTWTLDVPTAPMSDRVYAPIVYNPPTRMVTLFGGLSLGAAAFGDTWQWDGTSWEQISIAESPPPRGAHVIFPAADGNGVVLMGGLVPAQDVPLVGADTWQLRYESTAPFEQCALTVDDDRDGLAGCADPDCWARCTPLCPPGSASCPATLPRCGDGTCNAALESCRNCPQDCMTCAAKCGDGFCDAPESITTCKGDCTP